jgi:hypothetical protein
VLPVMFSELGLKEPPPIDILAVLVGAQAGVGDGLGLGDGLVPGDGLGEGLVPGDGLGLGDVLGLGEGLGLGLCASATLAPTLRKITPRATTARWTQCDCFRCRVRGARLDWVAWS